jgi:hypothetical protein
MIVEATLIERDARRVAILDVAHPNDVEICRRDAEPALSLTASVVAYRRA